MLCVFEFEHKFTGHFYERRSQNFDKIRQNHEMSTIFLSFVIHKNCLFISKI